MANMCLQHKKIYYQAVLKNLDNISDCCNLLSTHWHKC